MNKQEAFNVVVEHLLTQNNKSIINGQCAYRGEGGRMCAIGIFISDDVYNKEVESTSANSLGTYILLLTSGILNKEVILDVVFLGELQRLHDSHPVRTWHYALKNLGNRHYLDVSVLGKYT